MRPGDLLLPNEYQIQRGDPLSGLVLDTRCVLRSTQYKVFLTNENTVWLDESSVKGLFNVVQLSDTKDQD